MNSILSSIISVFLTVPLLGFVFVYLLFKVITKNARTSLHKASDFSTLFFITAVHFLVMTIWGKSYLWLIFLIMISIAMIFVIIHWKVKGEIIFNKVFKGFWRLNFIIFFVAYLTLTVIGLLHRALTFTFFS